MYAFTDIPRDEARRVSRCSRVCREINREVRSTRVNAVNDEIRRRRSARYCLLFTCARLQSVKGVHKGKGVRIQVNMC